MLLALRLRLALSLRFWSSAAIISTALTLLLASPSRAQDAEPAITDLTGGWTIGERGRVKTMPLPPFPGTRVAWHGLFFELPSGVDDWLSTLCWGASGASGYQDVRDIRESLAWAFSVFYDLGLGSQGCTAPGTYYYVVGDSGTRQNLYVYSLKWNGVLPSKPDQYTNGLGFGLDVNGNQWNVWGGTQDIWDWHHDYVQGYLHYSFRVYNYAANCPSHPRVHNVWTTDPTKGFGPADLVQDVVLPQSCDDHVHRVDIQWNANGYHVSVFDETDAVPYLEGDHSHAVTASMFDSWTNSREWNTLPDYPRLGETGLRYIDEEPIDHARRFNTDRLVYSPPGSGVSGGGWDVRTDALPVVQPRAFTGVVRVTTNLSTAGFTINGPNNFTQRGSGTTFVINDAAPGTYSVHYDPASCYTPPPTETIELGAGEDRTVTGTYNGAATLVVSVEPLAAAWATFAVSPSVLGLPSTQPYSYPVVISGLEPTSYEVAFGPVDGYSAPESQVVVPDSSCQMSVVGSYTPDVGGVASLRVVVNKGGFTVKDSAGAVVPKQRYGSLSPGYYSVEFSPLKGFFAPETQRIQLSSGDASVISGTYRKVAIVSFTGWSNGDCVRWKDVGMAAPVCAKWAVEYPEEEWNNPGIGVTQVLWQMKYSTQYSAQFRPLEARAFTFYTAGNGGAFTAPSTESGSQDHLEAEAWVSSLRLGADDRMIVIGHSYGGHRAGLFVRQLQANRGLTTDMLIPVDPIDWSTCRLTSPVGCDQKDLDPRSTGAGLAVSFRQEIGLLSGDRLSLVTGYRTAPLEFESVVSETHGDIDDDATVKAGIIGLVAGRSIDRDTPGIRIAAPRSVSDLNKVWVPLQIAGTGSRTLEGLVVSSAFLNGKPALNLNDALPIAIEPGQSSNVVWLAFEAAATISSRVANYLSVSGFVGGRVFSFVYPVDPFR